MSRPNLPRGLSFVLMILIPSFLVFILPAFAAEQTETKPRPPGPGHVFVIIVDGLQARALTSQQAPNLASLANAGVTVKQFVAALPDEARAATATVLTGLEPDRHGYIDRKDAFRHDTILSRAAEKGFKTVVFDGSNTVLTPLVQQKNCIYKGSAENKDRAVMDAVLTELEVNSYLINIIYLPQLKEALDKSGPNGKEYLESLANTDNQVGRLWHYFNQKALAGKSAVVVTGTGGSPPLFLKGPGLRNGTVIPCASHSDIAPTIAALLDIPMPPGSGTVLWDAFEPTGDRSNEDLLSRRLNDMAGALYSIKRENSMLCEEKKDAEKSSFRMAADKQLIMKEIARRDQAIGRLNLSLKLMKAGMAGIIVFFLFLIYYQYRYLKKKFLFFD
ncbi:MAG: alkaline phosphatase family protein [Peptococcaceae bacterium]|nr:alkaline phosphatase family protein [Peptococcaceae bacterium]